MPRGVGVAMLARRLCARRACYGPSPRDFPRGGDGCRMSRRRGAMRRPAPLVLSTRLSPSAATASRVGTYLLIAAALILLAAGLRDVASPWEQGLRGANAAMYS